MHGICECERTSRRGQSSSENKLIELDLLFVYFYFVNMCSVLNLNCWSRLSFGLIFTQKQYLVECPDANCLCLNMTWIWPIHEIEVMPCIPRFRIVAQHSYTNFLPYMCRRFYAFSHFSCYPKKEKIPLKRLHQFSFHPYVCQLEPCKRGQGCPF